MNTPQTPRIKFSREGILNSEDIKQIRLFFSNEQTHADGSIKFGRTNLVLKYTGNGHYQVSKSVHNGANYTWNAYFQVY